jgi:gamma-glutamylcyclotransferase (GGCT)/AIG2-like uncharacterized protein YtfP
VSDRSTKLFVYGTLRRSADNRFSRFLVSAAQELGPAQAFGRLFDLGNYPGMTISEGDSQVVFGELYELRDPASSLPVLDAYEGCGEEDVPPFEFERRMISVRTDDGRPVYAWAYLYRGDTAGKPEISSGDYFEHAGR